MKVVYQNEGETFTGETSHKKFLKHPVLDI